MGQTQTSLFTPEQLEHYSRCTFFTKNEVIELHERFSHYHEEGSDPFARISMESALDVLEMLHNPFGPRILAFFSDDGGRTLGFEEFIECCSTLSPRATLEEKIQLAFRCYDMNDDHMVDHDDIREVVKLMTANQLDEADLELVVDKTMEEADIDGSGTLTYHEFHKLASRLPDFQSKFTMTIV